MKDEKKEFWIIAVVLVVAFIVLMSMVGCSHVHKTECVTGYHDEYLRHRKTREILETYSIPNLSPCNQIDWWWQK